MSETSGSAPYDHTQEPYFEQDIDFSAIEGMYQEKLHSFRIEVGALLLRHEALHIDAGWAVFNFYDFEADADDSEQLTPDIDIIVCMRPKKTVINSEFTLSLPEIRIIYNERFDVEDGVDYLTKDVTIDENGNACCFVSAFPVRESLEQDESSGSLFYINNNKIVTSRDPGVGLYALKQTVQTNVNGRTKKTRHTLYPQGDYKNPEDRIHALTEAIELLDTVKSLEPAQIYLGPQI